MPLSILSFTDAKSFPSSKGSDTAVITNGDLFKEIVPERIYNYVIDKIERYRNAHNTPAMTYTIQDSTIYRSRSDGYSFTLIPSDDSASPIPVTINVVNYGNFFGITVTIDGEVQDIS
jgi:hypothetical protein